MPALALTAGLLALLLSLLAIVLATIANRRHMAARRRPAPAAAAGAPEQRDRSGDAVRGDEDAVAREQALRELRSRVDTLDEVVAGLSSAVERLVDPVVSGESRLEALDAQVAAMSEQVVSLTDHVASVSDQGDSLSTRLDALAEQAAEVLARTDRVALGLHATDGRAQDHSQLVAAQIQSLTGQVAALRDHVLSADPTALRHVAVVRYDAFADVGGRLSYSLAVLDDLGSGFVVTTLAGKAEVRTYVRAVSQEAGDGTLTAEEQQAIEAARQGAGSRP